MATAAQISANRDNAQHSTGPRTEAGKQASSKNNFRHGLTGHGFIILDWELAEDFDTLQQALIAEHQPKTPTEEILVEKMVQHYWLNQRAQYLLTLEVSTDSFDTETHNASAIYIRHQAHHDRLFQRALHDLLKLRAEKRKAEIGFELQERAEAQETRRESGEKRKVERHSVDIDIRKARLEREQAKLNGPLSPQKQKIAA
jgi:hypothetical protein